MSEFWQRSLFIAEFVVSVIAWLITIAALIVLSPLILGAFIIWVLLTNPEDVK